MYGEIISDAASHGLSRLIALDRHSEARIEAHTEAVS
jgi:hypothetical protein